MTPEQRAGDALRALQSPGAGMRPRKKKSGWLGPVAIGTAAAVGYHLYRQREDEKAPRDPCLTSLVQENAGRPSAYSEARAVFAQRPDGEDYVHCVMLEVCRAQPREPRPYFFKQLHTGHNNCRRAERRYQRRVETGAAMPDQGAEDDALDRIAIDTCASSLSPTERDALRVAAGEITRERFAAAHRLSPASVSKYVSRAQERFHGCLGDYGYARR
jgi:DNA-directed RNA polymerase specialized sigma24 family protein